MNDRRDQIGTSVAWGLWTLAQVGWLAMSAERVGLSAKWPGAGETWAAMGMVAVQLVLAGAMGRTLLRDVRTGLSAVSVACPMLGLAVVMGGGRVIEASAAMLCVSAWLGVLAGVGSIRSTAVRAPVTGLLLILLAAGPVILYLEWEFGRRTVGADGILASISPTMGAISTLTHGIAGLGTIITPCCILVGILVTHLLARAKTQRPAGDTRLKGLVG